MIPYWSQIEQLIKESDVVLYILDARLAEMSRNEEIEKLIKQIGRPVIYVLNKSDLIKRQELESSIDKLKQETGSEVVYASHKKKNTTRNLLARIRKTFEIFGKPEREEYTKNIEKEHRVAKADIVVGVVGYPNVGKSSIINSLSFKKKAKVSETAGTTHGVHWIKAGDDIKLIDSPGVIPLKYIDETKLGLISAKGIEKLKDKDIVAGKIIEMFLNSKKNRLEEFYNLKIPEGLNSYEALEHIGKIKSHLKKGGLVDVDRTADIIVRDWQNGKLRL